MFLSGFDLYSRRVPLKWIWVCHMPCEKGKPNSLTMSIGSYILTCNMRKRNSVCFPWGHSVTAQWVLINHLRLFSGQLTFWYLDISLKTILTAFYVYRNSTLYTVIVCFIVNVSQKVMFFLYFRDSNTLFRGNSVATKSVDEFMKHAGLYYLHDTIKCLVDEVTN